MALSKVFNPAEVQRKLERLFYGLNAALGYRCTALQLGTRLQARSRQETSDGQAVAVSEELKVCKDCCIFVCSTFPLLSLIAVPSSQLEGRSPLSLPLLTSHSLSTRQLQLSMEAQKDSKATSSSHLYSPLRLLVYSLLPWIVIWELFTLIRSIFGQVSRGAEQLSRYSISTGAPFPWPAPKIPRSASHRDARSHIRIVARRTQPPGATEGLDALCSTMRGLVSCGRGRTGARR